LLYIAVKKITKIGQYLSELSKKYKCLVFYGPQCSSPTRLRSSIAVAASWSVAVRQSVSLWPAGGHWRATG